MNEQAAKFIGSIPEHYDRLLGPLLFSPFANDMAGRVAGIQASTVLELAAGTGIVSRQLRDTLPASCELVITDLNPPMLEVAAARFEPGEKVRLEPANAADLNYPDEMFDAVACQFGVMFFPDKLASHIEVLRVLKPGGCYLFNVWDAWEYNPFARIAHGVVLALFPDDPPGFYKVPFSYSQPAEITGTLAKAGFTQVDIETVTLTVDIPSVADFATGLVFGNPLHEEIAARNGDPHQVCSEIAAAISAELGNELPLQALVVSAVK